MLEGGRSALAGKEDRDGERELRRKIRELEWTLGRKAHALEIGGKHREAGSEHAHRRSRELVAAAWASRP